MSLRWKLLISYAAVILLALVLASVVTVALRWNEQQQAALDRLAVAAPQISLDVFRLQRQGAPPEQVGQFVRDEGRQRDVRVLLIDRNDTVLVDSDTALRGKRLAAPPDGERIGPFGYRHWEGEAETGRPYIFLALRGGRPGDRLAPPDPDGRVVVAVPRQTVTRAWLGLLPGLTTAALIALGLSAVVAVLLSRSIARPLQALTRASEAMARGDYDQEILLRRNDEVGRLASAFNTMAREVGRSHVQMRTLIANVSHDLKTPLTSILGFGQALRDGAVTGDRETADTGAIIHDEAQRVEALVDDLLYLSEIEAGQVVVTSEPIDLATVALRAARRFEPALRAAGIELTAALPDVLPVCADTAKLERILDNLLDNARKYTPRGGRVEVRGQRCGGKQPTVRLAVFNSGSFIPDDDRERVFERFYRRDRARSRPGGTGLGLAIARELADLHRGTLRAASDTDGTTFVLTLPAVVGVQTPARGDRATPDRAAQPMG